MKTEQYAEAPLPPIFPEEGALFSMTVSVFQHSDNLSRTLLCADAAVCTFLRINMRQEVIHSNCLRFTIFFTEPAADAPCLAHFHQ